ncbi:MAG: hypothetical protein LBE09_06980 [Christensenellaceae bacterium]|jgi:hypothetical protein|nr:hypothetical protein [Christensenellaceae bacterium]
MKIRLGIVVPIFIAVVVLVAILGMRVTNSEDALAATAAQFKISCLVTDNSQPINGDFLESVITYGKDSAIAKESNITYLIEVVSGTISEVEWARSDSPDGEFTFDGTNSGYSIRITKVSETGYYKARVTFSDPSAVMFSEITLHAVVNPRAVNANWTNLTFVYDGQEHKPSATVQDFAMGVTNIGVTIIGAQTYANNETEPQYTAEITSNDTNYVISDAYKTKAFTITKCPVTVDWSTDEVEGKIELIFDGDPIAPTAKAYTLEKDGSSPIPLALTKYADANIDSPIPYVTIASISSTAEESVQRNYTLSNVSKAFYIAPLEIKLKWDETTLELIYNGSNQSPVPIATFKSENVAILSDDINYGGTDVGRYTAKAIPKSSNFIFIDDYVSENTNAIAYSIKPLPSSVTWFDAAPGKSKEIVIPDEESKLNITLTYDGTEQISKIVAAIIGLDSEEVQISVSCLNDVVRNAGEYELTAVIEAGRVLNYSIAEDAISKVKIRIGKAISVITATELQEYTYSGSSFSVSANNTSGTLYYRIGGKETTNYFTAPNVYQIELYALETSNYFAPQPVYVTLIINAVELSAERSEIKEGEVSSGILKLPDGISPMAALKIDDLSNVSKDYYAGTAVRTVDKLYSASITASNTNVSIPSGSILMVKVDGYVNGNTLNIITKKDGVFIEQNVTMEDGYFSIVLYDDAKFAITTVDYTMVTIWWVIAITILTITVVIVVISFFRKRRKYAEF